MSDAATAARMGTMVDANVHLWDQATNPVFWLSDRTMLVDMLGDYDSLPERYTLDDYLRATAPFDVAGVIWSDPGAREWGKYGISVNTVNPSLRTDAWENWEANNTEFVQGLKDKMPLGFLGDPEEHGAPWIVWLAGKGGEYVTGMTIMLNGGRHMP